MYSVQYCSASSAQPTDDAHHLLVRREKLSERLSERLSQVLSFSRRLVVLVVVVLVVVKQVKQVKQVRHCFSWRETGQ